MPRPLVCGYCGVQTVLRAVAGPVVVVDGATGYHVGMALCDVCAKPSLCRVAAENSTYFGSQVIYPIQRDEAPAEYPADVGDNFREALVALNKGIYRASLMTARSALQAACREQKAKGGDLKAEISDLVQKGVIPRTLGDWADEVRLGANLVAHPKPSDPVGLEDAVELLGLAESIFEYLYVIPERVQRRRARRSQPGSGGTVP